MIDTLLTFLSQSGSLADLSNFLKKDNRNVNDKSIVGLTPLMLAAQRSKDRYECIHILLEHGADPMIETARGETAIYFILEKEYLRDTKKILTMLLNLGCKANINWTLCTDSETRRCVYIQMMLESYVDSDLLKQHLNQAFKWCIDNCTNQNLQFQTIKLLIRLGTDPCTLSSKGDTWLMHFVKNASAHSYLSDIFNEAIKLGIKAGIEMLHHIIDQNGWFSQSFVNLLTTVIDDSKSETQILDQTLLLMEIIKKSNKFESSCLIEATQILISRGIDANLIDGNNNTLLIYAIGSAYFHDHITMINVIHKLLEAKCDPNLISPSGCTTIKKLFTTFNFFSDALLRILELLLNYGVDPNTLVQRKPMILYFLDSSMSLRGSTTNNKDTVVKCIKSLLDAGANPHFEVNGCNYLYLVLSTTLFDALGFKNVHQIMIYLLDLNVKPNIGSDSLQDLTSMVWKAFITNIDMKMFETVFNKLLDVIEIQKDYPYLAELSILVTYSPSRIYNMMHRLLLCGANPNVTHKNMDLPLVSIIHNNNLDFNLEITKKILKLLLNHGADSNAVNDNNRKMMWNYITPETRWIIDLTHKIAIEKHLHKILLKEICREGKSIIYHPDRLRIRILNLQNRLNEASYNEWLEKEAGWLEYLGIYDFQSFQEKMMEYNRFLD